MHVVCIPVPDGAPKLWSCSNSSMCGGIHAVDAWNLLELKNLILIAKLNAGNDLFFHRCLDNEPPTNKSPNSSYSS